MSPTYISGQTFKEEYKTELLLDSTRHIHDEYIIFASRKNEQKARMEIEKTFQEHINKLNLELDIWKQNIGETNSFKRCRYLSLKDTDPYIRNFQKDLYKELLISYYVKQGYNINILNRGNLFGISISK